MSIGSKEQLISSFCFHLLKFTVSYDRKGAFYLVYIQNLSLRINATFFGLVSQFPTKSFLKKYPGDFADEQYYALLPTPADFTQLFSMLLLVQSFIPKLSDDARKTWKKLFFDVPQEELVIVVALVYLKFFWTIQFVFLRRDTCRSLTSRFIVTTSFKAHVIISSNFSP